MGVAGWTYWICEDLSQVASLDSSHDSGGMDEGGWSIWVSSINDIESDKTRPSS